MGEEFSSIKKGDALHETFALFIINGQNAEVAIPDDDKQEEQDDQADKQVN